MTSMFAKICGLRNVAEIECAVEAGADAVGFVLTTSPRQVTIEEATRLARAVPPEVLSVGVFMGLPSIDIAGIIAATGITMAQLHGNYAEPDFAYLAELGIPLVRATSLSEGVDTQTGAFGEQMLILDSPQAGSGDTWDWSALANSRPTGHWLLAGGLHPDNVAEAIDAAKPWGVDVSSGVESSRGVKDLGKIRDFMSNIRYK
jgi:phosphoribosylanthranilate isomerase